MARSFLDDYVNQYGRHDLVDYRTCENLTQEQLTGDETVLKSLGSGVFRELANNAIEKHEVKNDVALVSLCTNTRPYYNSPKWKKYMEIQDVDFMVFSNGFLVGERFWNEFLLLTYNAPARGGKVEEWLRNQADCGENPEGPIKFTHPTYFEGTEIEWTPEELALKYDKLMHDNTIKFFSENKYKKVFADITMKHRSFLPFMKALIYLEDNNIIEGFDYPRVDIVDEMNFDNIWGYPTLEDPYYSEMVVKIDKLNNE